MAIYKDHTYLIRKIRKSAFLIPFWILKSYLLTLFFFHIKFFLKVPKHKLHFNSPKNFSSLKRSENIFCTLQNFSSALQFSANFSFPGNRVPILLKNPSAIQPSNTIDQTDTQAFDKTHVSFQS